MASSTKTNRPLAAGFFDELIVDNFAGGGGASLGIERAIGRAIDIAINHDRAAIEMHTANHPHTRHLCEDVWSVDPAEVCAGRPVGLVWLSPDCKHFSRAKGGKPVEKRIRGLAWIGVKWLKAVRPRVLVLENVREFQEWGPLTADQRPCPVKKGLTFRRFIGAIRNLGYAIEWKVLNAADYGAPTHRRRLFIIARRDGLPIVWPEPTHGPGRKPYRTAAECIDWSLPCHSIFLTREEARSIGVKRPLAEKTMRRIAMGLKRYVIDNPKPFIVNIERSYKDFAGQAIDRPLGTITASPKGGKHALVTPLFTHVNHGGERKAHDPAAPLPTITGAHRGEIGLVAPYLAANYGEAPHQETRGQSVDEPLRTVTPANTLDTQNRFGVASAHLVKFRGDSKGSAADTPLPTITSGDGAARPAGAAHAMGVCLTQFRGTNAGNGGDPREPMPTITAQGFHVAEVRAFLIKYFGTNIGQSIDGPMQTQTSKHRFGLVTVEGQPYEVIDIGLRMLTPRELARAQGFPDDYILIGSKSNQVAKIGNSVCPPIAEAIVRANFNESQKADVA